jgi:hypothetical protein
MAKGYPSRHRAQKAFWRGVKTAKTGRGINPYRNEYLKKLFERGKLNPAAVPPPQFAPKPKPNRPTRLSDRSARASGGSRTLGGTGGSAFGRPLRFGDRPQTPPPPQRRPRPEGW